MAHFNHILQCLLALHPILLRMHLLSHTFLEGVNDILCIFSDFTKHA